MLVSDISAATPFWPLGVGDVTRVDTCREQTAQVLREFSSNRLISQAKGQPDIVTRLFPFPNLSDE